MSTVVVSVRVRREVKEELERAGVDIGEAVRRCLEALAARERRKQMLKEWRRIHENIAPSEPGFAAGSVREDRESR